MEPGKNEKNRFGDSMGRQQRERFPGKIPEYGKSDDHGGDNIKYDRTGHPARLHERTDQKYADGNQQDHFFIFQKNSLHLKLANFSSLKRRSIFTSRKILREKLELHSASKKSLNIAKMVEKRFELPVSTHDLAYEKIRLADCHKTLIFSDKSENPHARVTGVHKFLTFTPPSVPVDNREASHQEMKPL